MNSKSYRDMVLEYIEILGEIDKAEDKNTANDEINKLKKKASDLKQQIDTYKLKKNERS